MPSIFHKPEHNILVQFVYRCAATALMLLGGKSEYSVLVLRMVQETK